MGRDIRIIPDTGPESVIDFFRALYIVYRYYRTCIKLKTPIYANIFICTLINSIFVCPVHYLTFIDVFVHKDINNIETNNRKTNNFSENNRI